MVLFIVNYLRNSITYELNRIHNESLLLICLASNIQCRITPKRDRTEDGVHVLVHRMQHVTSTYLDIAHEAKEASLSVHAKELCRKLFIQFSYNFTYP